MNSQDESGNEFTAKIAYLERQNEKLTRKLQKRKDKPSAIIGLFFISFGIIAIILSIWYEKLPIPLVLPQLPLMFIGIALIFWGSLLLFVRANRYVRLALLDASILSSLEALNQLITGFKYDGQAVYLPPKFFNELSVKVFISKKGVPPSVVAPPSKPIDVPIAFNSDNNGIYITPPGASLARLFGDELGKDFDHISLNYLMEHIPKIFVENLELAKSCDFSYEYESNTVAVKMKGVSYGNLCERICGQSKICGTIGCPVCSAIVCALTTTIGKPIVIISNSFSTNKKIVSLRCKILEE
jgi:hypothetical protein